MFLLRPCSINITHDTCSFEEFYKDFNEKNLSDYNMENIKYRKFYVRALYKAINADDINNIK